MSFYPVVKIPSKLDEISRLHPPTPQKPAAPILPQRIANLPEPPQEVEIKEPTSTNEGVGCFGFILAACVMIFFIQIAGETYNGGIMMVAIILGLIGLWGVNGTSKENQKSYEKYIEEKKEYPNRIKLAKEKFILEQQHYEEQIALMEKNYYDQLELYKSYEYPLFLENLKVYEQESRLIKDEDYIKEFRKTKRKDFFRTSLKPHLEMSSTNAKKGVSENYFLTFLADTFGSKILCGYSLSIDPTLSFVPDFTIFDKELGYHIDIEIDEPYIGKNGKPIHFLESNYDKWRDFYFMNSNWVVIRFAEEQIIRYPEICCDFIANVINEICQSLSYIESKNLNLPKVKRWTKEEAHEMAFNRYRNTYLFKELAESLLREDQYIPNSILEKKEIPPQKQIVEEKKVIQPPYQNKTDKSRDQDDLPF
jgi:hypothetical protein